LRSRGVPLIHFNSEKATLYHFWAEAVSPWAEKM
jgi:hypothetical protein